jgi:hypothetical protein
MDEFKEKEVEIGVECMGSSFLKFEGQRGNTDRDSWFKLNKKFGD